MSQAIEKKSFKELCKEKRGKVALLGLIAMVSLYIWSGILFGKKDAKHAPVQPSVAGGSPAQPAAPAAPHASRAASTPSAAARAVSSLGPITTFEVAVKRIDTWSEPLSLHLQREAPEIDEFYLPDEEEFLPEDDVSEEVLSDLTLTATALLGDHRYAVINGKRLQEGERISRYEIKEIRAREVLLQGKDGTQTLKIAEPSLKHSNAKKLSFPEN